MNSIEDVPGACAGVAICALMRGIFRRGRGRVMLKRLLWLLLALSFSAGAADFSLQDMQGRTHRLADYRGKWVLVNFWATWCPPCLNEIPELVSLHDAREVAVIGIAVDSGSRKHIASFAEARGISYPLVMGNDRIIAQIGEVEVLPTSYLYAPNGELVSYQAGEVTRASIEAYIGSRKSSD